MIKEHTTVEDVIKALGGTKAVAELTGRTDPAVSNWKARKCFPPGTLIIIKSALSAKGGSAPDSLWQMTEESAA